MTRALRRGVLVAAATAVCLALLCGNALAGSYYVNACSPSTSSGLWAAVNTFPTSFTTANNCGGPAGSEVGPLDNSNQGALYAEDTLGSFTNMPDGSRAGWMFTAPTDTTITAIRYYRSLAAYNQPNVSAGLVQADGSVVEECRIDTAFGSSNTCSKPGNQGPFEFTGLNTSSLFFGVICRVIFAGGGCGAGATIHTARASMYSARVTLSESTLPALSGLSGPLWGGGVVSGVVPVTFSASDATGIQQLYVRADPGGVIAGANQTCDSMLAQPCPQLPAGSQSVDTRRGGDGPHTFTLVVVDAAGNQQTATSPPIVVRNQAAAVPPPAIAPPPPPPSSTVPRTRIRAVITGRQLRVTGSIARSGRVRVSWRSKRAGRTLAYGSRVVTIRRHKVAATFMLSRRARSGTTRIAVRSGRRIVAQARARRG
ncbi:MAG TPA: hypothetical protein VGO80_03605 [Solirubrobacteraceae bacterium]|jgi:hypothetical protein|nr:hypothetical protein [Solirubrobacteraceae bacterium]